VPRNLADLLISLCFFVNLTAYLTVLIITDFLQSHTSVLALLISISAKTLRTLSQKRPLSTSAPAISRATPPTPFPVVIGRTTKGFYFRWLTKLKILTNKLKFP
jgi:hypothetical protein